MKNMLLLALALTTTAALAGCKKKEENKATDKPTTATKPGDPPATDKAPPPPPAAADKEIDLSVWGPDFAGYVAMAPDGTKVTFDDPSRQLAISDSDFLSVGEAPYWADGIKVTKEDKDNTEIKDVSPTEVRWVRNPPLGKEWAFDLKVDIAGKPYSCSGSTFTDGPMADKLAGICKSIKKK